MLKIFSFQDRHENKDAYDLVFTLLNQEGGPHAAGAAAADSPVASHPQITEALALLGERFADIAQDGPAAYAVFLASADDQEDNTRLRREAVATVRAFLDGFEEGHVTPDTRPRSEATTPNRTRARVDKPPWVLSRHPASRSRTAHPTSRSSTPNSPDSAVDSGSATLSAWGPVIAIWA